MQGTTNNEPSGQDEIKASNDDATSSGWTLDGFDACSAMLLEEDSKPNWDTLQSIETRRRYILDKVEQPVWRILGTWDGTCLRALLTDWLVWLPIIVFISIRIQAYSGVDQPANFVDDILGQSNVDILGGFVSFLLVIFVNQTNERFLSMYQLSKRCCGLIQDTAGLVSCQFPDSARKERLIRYMNASHVAGYVGLGGPYSKRHFFDHFNQEHNLLNKDELAKVDHHNMDSGSATFKELITWCQLEVAAARKAGHIDTYEAVELQNRCLNFRAAMDGIYDYCEQPTQFFYIHFLVLISTIYLPLFAVGSGYSSGWGDEMDWKIEILNVTIVALQAIFVVGLRLLAQKMVDPYGLDLEDLSVISYIYVGIENSNIIMSAQPPPN